MYPGIQLYNEIKKLRPLQNNPMSKAYTMIYYTHLFMCSQNLLGRKTINISRHSENYLFFIRQTLNNIVFRAITREISFVFQKYFSYKHADDDDYSIFFCRISVGTSCNILQKA